MRAVQVSFFRDPRGRDPEALLRAWPTLTDVAEAAHQEDAPVAVVQAADRDAVVERNGVTYHFVYDRCLPRRAGRRPLVLPFRVARRVRAIAPDVVHVHGFTAPIATWWLRSRLHGVPMLVQDHGGLPSSGWRGVVAARCWRDLDAVCFTDRNQVAPYVAAGQLRASVPVFGVPESSTRFTPGSRDEARARTGLHGRPCLVWVGRLNANKDPLSVLDALARAAPALPNLQLWCCYGEAPLLDAVRARIGQLPTLTDRVHLLGTVPHRDVEFLLRASDFLVLGSRREGSGYAVLEALACGVTPVVTDIPSFRRLTDGGRVGSVTAPGDAEAMARSLCTWWRKPASGRRHMALEFFARELSFVAVGRQLRSMYATVAGAP